MVETAIIVQNVTKIYPLYNDPVDRLKESLHPLRKKYHREFFALNDISFTVKKGETVGIIGRNGSGKSTLLKVLTGVLTPSSGTASTQGRVLALLELGAGFNPELSGIENIYFNGALLGASQQEIDSRLQSILDFADIGEFVYQPVKTYSSGMIVRLAFAVIANMDADILIIDEALSVGDAFFVQKCMRFLRKFIETGTLLFVSHDTSAVLNLCSRAIWLSGGNIYADDTPKVVSEAYLANMFESQQGVGAVNAVTNDFSIVNEDPLCPEDEYRDIRQDFINSTLYRNDLEIFQFDESAPSFGNGGAFILSVVLTDAKEKPLSWIVGGEMVRLLIRCHTQNEIYSPIVGFYFKDRLGQVLFGDNTFNFTSNAPLNVGADRQILASFEFRMPILPTGDYSVTASIAEGTQLSHVQHHWIYDALVLKSHSSSVSTGLVGVPMRSIRINAI